MPEFFGNFYIEKQSIKTMLEKFETFNKSQDRTEQLRRGADFYGAPCNYKSKDYEAVTEILDCYPKALKKCLTKNCGLLGLVVVAG